MKLLFPFRSSATARRRASVYGFGPRAMISAIGDPDATLFICVTCRSADIRLRAFALARLCSTPLRRSDRGRGEAAHSPACGGMPFRVQAALHRRAQRRAANGPMSSAISASKLMLDDILTAAQRFARTHDGIVPWRERPNSFRKGVVSRTPPLMPAEG